MAPDLFYTYYIKIYTHKSRVCRTVECFDHDVIFHTLDMGILKAVVCAAGELCCVIQTDVSTIWSINGGVDKRLKAAQKLSHL